jgi:hypothetical protein
VAAMKQKRRHASIPRVAIASREAAPDALVDALAMLWNEQESDDSAYAYFHRAVPSERGGMLAASLYRYPPREREFLARLLLDLARAVNIGLFRYIT